MTDAPLPRLELFRHARRSAAEPALRTRHERGELIRIRSGVYVPADAWAALDADDRYRALVRATASVVNPATQFSHDSAAAIWRLPNLGPWPARSHTTGPATNGGRSSSGIIRHGFGLDPLGTMIDGVRVTSLARTIADMATSTEFVRAVGMADDAFRGAPGRPRLTRARLRDLIEAEPDRRGSVRAQRVLDFADGRAESLGESMSRVQLSVLGLPAPQLQVPISDERGRIGVVDFYWPQLGLVGEFDGRVKYRKAEYLRRRLPEEVVWAEKLREDRMRRVVQGFVRWDWATASNPAALLERVRPFGLVPTIRRPRAAPAST